MRRARFEACSWLVVALVVRIRQKVDPSPVSECGEFGMKRVEAALKEGRCVVALGSRALGNAEVMIELRRRSLPTVALSSEPVPSTATLSEESLSPILQKQGGILVLVEPDGASDGRALSVLARLLKGGSHKPKLYVAARAFNPFGLPMDMRLMKMEQLKLRAADFVAQLPLDAIKAEPVETKKQRRRREIAQVPAPRPVFVGREEECAALLSHLDSEGGPVVVTGPQGSGRRWLVEHCLAQRELERLPDLRFGRGADHDTFLALLAMICKEAGDESLHDCIQNPKKRPPAQELASLVLQSLQSEALAQKVWVLDGLDSLLDRRDGSFYRDDGLSIILRAVMKAPISLKIVFLARMAPTFYREGEAAHLRNLELGGLKGKELHELFDAWQIPEFERDRFGPIVERTHGHPVASRYFGVAVREDGNVDALLKEPKFLKARELSDLDPLGRHIKRRVGELDEEIRHALCVASLFTTPVSAQALQSAGIKRLQRITLLSRGLLEQTPLQDERRYYVHPLVRIHLSLREILDFERMKSLAELMLDQSRQLKQKGSLAASMSAALAANRLLTLSRNGRAKVVLPYPDNDPVLENIRELLRRKKPRLDIARMRLKEAMKVDPRNPKLYLAELDLAHLENKKDFDAAALFNHAIAECPVPDLFHSQATMASRKNQRGKAVTALEAGVQVFPANARLRRRLASLQLSQNRVEDARDTLKAAQDLEPMMPDIFSQLSEVYMRLGIDHIDDAKACLEEALRLDPEGSQHHARQGEFFRIQAMLEPDKRDELLEAAEACLREASRLEPGHSRIQVGLATILIDRSGDLEQAEWLIKKSLKRSETSDGLVQQARLRIRQGVLEDVDRILERATKKEPSNHAAFAARAELWMGQGQIFHAFEALKTARERSPKGCPDRVLYEAQMKQLGALIESGQAAELLKASGSAETPVEATEEEGLGPRRDAGNTTRLRKARSADDAAESDSSLSPEEAPALPAAEQASDSPQDASTSDEDSSESEDAGASDEAAAESEAASSESDEPVVAEESVSDASADDPSREA